MTYTYAILEVGHAAYAEIKAKLQAAGYQDQFHDDRDGVVIDMRGLALKDDGLVAILNSDGCLPCPFCRWEHTEVTSEGESSPRAYFVQCRQCWACGPAAGSEQYDTAQDNAERQKAVAAWNERAA